MLCTDAIERTELHGLGGVCLSVCVELIVLRISAQDHTNKAPAAASQAHFAPVVPPTRRCLASVDRQTEHNLHPFPLVSFQSTMISPPSPRPATQVPTSRNTFRSS
jgi:hypothetical protein